MFVLNSVAIFLISLYQKTLSLDHGVLGKIFPHSRVCRFFPSCSEYSKRAFKKYNFLKALALSTWRVIRCGPWTPAGTYDEP